MTPKISCLFSMCPFSIPSCLTCAVHDVEIVGLPNLVSLYSMWIELAISSSTSVLYGMQGKYDDDFEW